MAESITQQVGEIKEPLSQFIEQSQIMINADKKLKRLDNKNDSKLKYFLIAGLPPVVFSILLICSVVSGWNTAANRMTSEVWGEIFSVAGIIFVITSIVAFIMWAVREAEIKATTEQYNTAYSKVKKSGEILKHLDIKVIPPDYRNRAALDFIHKALLNQRAMTMQEAVNLYEDDLHKKNMENLQKQQIELLKQQAEEIKKMRKSTKRIEFYEAWEFIFR